MRNLYKLGHISKKKRIESDEVLTPEYAVEPILKYLKKFKTVWCPFDKKNSKFVKLLKKQGHKVIATHIDDNKNFFKYKPEQFDAIVSNPPFSKKDKILKRCYKLKKPFALLLPVTALGGAKRQRLYREYGCEVLFLGGRIGFYTKNDLTQIKEKAGFECCYICHKILKKQIEYTEVVKTQKKY